MLKPVLWLITIKERTAEPVCTGTVFSSHVPVCWAQETWKLFFSRLRLDSVGLEQSLVFLPVHLDSWAESPGSRVNLVLVWPVHGHQPFRAEDASVSGCNY